MIIAGDINMDPKSDDPKVQNFVNILRSLDFVCLNFQPTRLTSCLDNFITNLHPSMLTCEIIQPHLSDHCALLLNYNMQHLTSSSEPFQNIHCTFDTHRLLSKPCLDRLKHRLRSVTWDSFFLTATNVELAFQTFLQVLSDCLNESCPLKKKSLVNHSRPRYKSKSLKLNWYTPLLREIRLLLDLSHEKGRTDPQCMAIHGRLKKMYRQEIILAKKRANEKFIFESHNKCKAAWKVINAETGRVPNKAKEKIPITADDFNSFFINVVNVLKNNCDILDVASSVDMLKSSGIKPPGLSSFKWTVVNSRDVYSSVYRLSNSRSEDVYGLSNFVLKEILDAIIYPLTQLINWVLTDGIYPQCLKITITVPIHKKGDKMNLNNYRPIALVPVISKLIETIVKNQLEYYFEHNNLISSSQYGFRKNLSTIKAVESIVSYVLNSFENKEETAAVLLDLSKAFDVVPHDELIQKLKYYGLENNALSLIMSYLSNRLQLVKVGDQRSGLKRVASGVPQGSVLGPFLFTVFINDLPKFVPGKVVLYADDTTLLSSDRDSKLNDVVMGYMRERSYLWFSANKLTVNNNKTEEIVFSLRNSENKSVKLLGINLDSKLSWGIHTNHLCIRLARVIFLLKKLKLYTSLNLVISAYYTFLMYTFCMGFYCGATLVEPRLCLSGKRKPHAA
uniref:Reverse transcriptase domain-containing protein n=1 Tax=Homalodisca liturata TaxID=320908 RepID=A0A1B6K0Y6_9HEMI